ncbi:MAG TPA: DUF6580 family putative transport protein [Verrucomicrobiales bacterium]|nr:DUF6580 family putative transport protein [Verrucomicrobiales bacterium]
MAFYTVLCLSVLVFRLATGLSSHPAAETLANFSPIAALFLCGGLFIDRRYAWLLPLGVFVLSDLVLNWRYAASNPSVSFVETLLSPYLIIRYGLFLALFGAGRFLRAAANWPVLLGCAVTGSFLFYVVTNSASWLFLPEYPKSLAGWLQALTWGLPGFPPAFLFFRNTLLGDLVFTGLFALLLRPAFLPRTRAASPSSTAPVRL